MAFHSIFIYYLFFFPFGVGGGGGVSPRCRLSLDRDSKVPRQHRAEMLNGWFGSSWVIFGVF